MGKINTTKKYKRGASHAPGRRAACFGLPPARGPPQARQRQQMLKHINNSNGGGCSSSYELHSSDKVRILGGGCGGGEEARPGEPDAPCGFFASPVEAITGAARYITHSPKELLVHLEQRLCAGEARPFLTATDHPLIHTRTEKIYIVCICISFLQIVWHTDTYI